MVPVPPSLLHTTQPSRARDRTADSSFSQHTEPLQEEHRARHRPHMRVDEPPGGLMRGPRTRTGQAARVLHPDARAPESILRGQKLLPTALLLGEEKPALPSRWVMRVQGQTTGCGAPAQRITAGNCVPGCFQRCTQGWCLTRRPPARQTSESPSLSYLLLLPTLRTPARPPPPPCIGSAPFTQDSVRPPRATRYSARHLLRPPRALSFAQNFLSGKNPLASE